MISRKNEKISSLLRLIYQLITKLQLLLKQKHAQLCSLVWNKVRKRSIYLRGTLGYFYVKGLLPCCLGMKQVAASFPQCIFSSPVA